MEALLELVLEIILEGAVEATASQKVPLPVRIGLGFLLGAFFIGVFGLIFWVGLSTGQWPLMLLGMALLAGFGAWVWAKSREIRRHEKRMDKKL